MPKNIRLHIVKAIAAVMCFFSISSFAGADSVDEPSQVTYKSLESDQDLKNYVYNLDDVMDLLNDGEVTNEQFFLSSSGGSFSSGVNNIYVAIDLVKSLKPCKIEVEIYDVFSYEREERNVRRIVTNCEGTLYTIESPLSSENRRKEKVSERFLKSNNLNSLLAF